MKPKNASSKKLPAIKTRRPRETRILIQETELISDYPHCVLPVHFFDRALASNSSSTPAGFSLDNWKNIGSEDASES